MERSTYVSIAVIIIFLGFIGWVGFSSSVPGGKTARAGALSAFLAPGANQFDFGTVSMANGKVSHAFSVTNTGAEPLTIKHLYTSCMCTEATFSVGGTTYGPYGMPGHGFMPEIGASIPQGGEAAVTAIFDPAAHGPAGIGRIERVVTLEDATGRTLDLSFGATVTP